MSVTQWPVIEVRPSLVGGTQMWELGCWGLPSRGAGDLGWGSRSSSVECHGLAWVLGAMEVPSDSGGRVLSCSTERGAAFGDEKVRVTASLVIVFTSHPREPVGWALPHDLPAPVKNAGLVESGQALGSFFSPDTSVHVSGVAAGVPGAGVVIALGGCTFRLSMPRMPVVSTGLMKRPRFKGLATPPNKCDIPLATASWGGDEVDVCVLVPFHGLCEGSG